MKMLAVAFALALSFPTFATDASATAPGAQLELCNTVRAMMTSPDIGKDMRIFYENAYRLQNCAQYFNSDGRIKSPGLANRFSGRERGRSASARSSDAENARVWTYSPVELHGTWSFGRCSDNDAAFLVIHAVLVLAIENGEVSRLRLSLDPEADSHGWIRGSLEGQRQYFRRVADEPGMLEITAYPSGEDAPATGPGAAPPAWWSMERLKGCPGLPPGLQAVYGEMYSVLKAIDAAVLHCESETGRCAEAMFEVGDVHPDGSLNAAEISRLFRVLFQIGAVLDKRDPEVTMAIVATSVSLAPVIALWLISSFDYDGDDGLSLDEIMRDRILHPSSDISDLLSGVESVISDMKDSLGIRISDLDSLLRLLR